MNARLAKILKPAGIQTENIILNNESDFLQLKKEIRKSALAYIRRPYNSYMSSPVMKKPVSYPCIYNFSIKEREDGWVDTWYVNGSVKLDSLEVLEFLLAVDYDAAKNIANKVINKYA